jgi:hypothetical protein
MKSIDWNTASKLGLIERINKEILHPMGLAMTRNPETGVSESLLISDDGVWEYDPKMKSGVKTEEEVKDYLNNVVR